jgi:hypothetical protein
MLAIGLDTLDRLGKRQARKGRDERRRDEKGGADPFMIIRELDRFSVAQAIADASLYDGYLLYPHRPSSRRDQAWWQVGVLTPRAFGEARGEERCSVRTECVVDPGPKSRLVVRVRCRQVQCRDIEAIERDTGDFVPVDTVEVDEKRFVAWDEMVDQHVDLAPLDLLAGGERQLQERFTFTPAEDTELVRSANGTLVARIIRRRQSVEGRVLVSIGPADGDGSYLKVNVTVENSTGWSGDATRREHIMDRSMIGVHTMLAVDGGVFVSLVDPPDAARQAVAGCSNDEACPVLIGEDDVVLSSPIILHDHPEVVRDGLGDLYEVDQLFPIPASALSDDDETEFGARLRDHPQAARAEGRPTWPAERWERLQGAVRALRRVERDDEN